MTFVLKYHKIEVFIFWHFVIHQNGTASDAEGSETQWRKGIRVGTSLRAHTSRFIARRRRLQIVGSIIVLLGSTRHRRNPHLPSRGQFEASGQSFVITSATSVSIGSVDQLPRHTSSVVSFQIIIGLLSISSNRSVTFQFNSIHSFIGKSDIS